jgi:hypothetical protein
MSRSSKCATVWFSLKPKSGGTAVDAAHQWKDARIRLQNSDREYMSALDLTILVGLIEGEQWILWNFSLCDFLHPPVTSSRSLPMSKYSIRTLFSSTLNLINNLKPHSSILGNVLLETWANRKGTLFYPVTALHLKQVFSTSDGRLPLQWRLNSCYLSLSSWKPSELSRAKFDFGRVMEWKKKRNVWVSFPFAYNWSWVAVTKTVAICNSDFIVPSSFGQPQPNGRPCT